jgi:hypothetical protein
MDWAAVFAFGMISAIGMEPGWVISVLAAA